MVLIKGIAKTSLIDFQPYVSSTLFLGGCNFRCRFCHNPNLVTESHLLKDISENDIFGFFKEKKKWIDGVCISGGEPTIHNDLPIFLKKLKELGLLVKLDTNGSNPIMLRQIIPSGLADKIAMDIKAPRERYEEVCGIKVDMEKIQDSIDVIMKSGIDYEFRTTVVPGLVGKEDIIKIGEWLKGAKKFCIQQFRSRGPLLDKKLEGKETFNKDDIEDMKKTAEKYFDKVEVRYS